MKSSSSKYTILLALLSMQTTVLYYPLSAMPMAGSEPESQEQAAMPTMGEQEQPMGGMPVSTQTMPSQQTMPAMPAGNQQPTMPKQAMPAPQQSAMPKPTSMPAHQPNNEAMPTASAEQEPANTELDALTQQLQELNQRDLEAISTSMGAIDSLKAELKGMLQELGGQLDAARQEIAQAKTISFDILKQETEQEAQNLLDQVNTIAQSVKNTQGTAQNEFNTNFTNKTSDIKVEMTKIEMLIPAIEDRINQFTMSNPAAEQLIAQAQTQIPTPPPAEPSKEPVTSQSVGNRIYNAMSSTAAWIVQSVRKVTSWLIKPLENDPVKKKLDTQPEVVKTGVANPSNMAITTTTPEQAGVMPVTTMMPTTQMQPSNPIQQLNNAATEKLGNLDESSFQLDQIQFALNQSYQETTAMVKELKMKLYANYFIQNYLAKHPVQQINHQSPYWKKGILAIVSKSLDLIAMVGEAVINGVKKTYNYFFAPSLNQFSNDVQEKLKKLEEKEKNAV